MVLLCIEFVRWIHIHQCVWLDVADPMESECLTSDGLAMGQKAAKKNSCIQLHAAYQRWRLQDSIGHGQPSVDETFDI